MPNSSEVIRQYLKDAIAAEKASADELRSFAKEGDDDDVQVAFAQHADETNLQVQRLTVRLNALGADESSEGENMTGQLLDFVPKFPQAADSVEARLVQHLIAAFCIERGECAMYEALASLAGAAGDDVTKTLAREIQAEEQRAAEKFFHFLPTRSKIAFNVLTAGEVEPAVETKVGLA